MSNALKEAYAINQRLMETLEAKRKAQQKFLGQKDCPECEGSGEAEYEVGVPNYGAWLGGELETRIGECENCNGNGWIEDDGMDDENWSDENGS
jgi:ssDNA-binding Zn-finger/Zn-ribbon topoisomerase 1